MAGPVKYPRVKSTAKALGVAHNTLWLALAGQTNRPGLVAAYFELAAPAHLSGFPFVMLPIGTVLTLPPETDPAPLSESLKKFVRLEGSSLAVISPLPVSPWPILPSATSAAVPVPSQRRRRRKLSSKKSATKRRSKP